MSRGRPSRMEVAAFPSQFELRIAEEALREINTGKSK